MFARVLEGSEVTACEGFGLERRSFYNAQQVTLQYLYVYCKVGVRVIVL